MTKRKLSPGSQVEVDIEAAVRKLLKATVGEDPHRQGLQDTPSRFRRAWLLDWTSGYSASPESVLKSFEDGAEDYDEMILVSNNPVFSRCEHHLSDMFGLAHVAYIPNGRIVGLSKIPRLVDIFARRLQVQERLTKQIADALSEYLNPKGVGVVIELRHLCLESRGIKARGTVTTTSALRGSFSRPEVREEFLRLANTGRHMP